MGNGGVSWIFSVDQVYPFRVASGIHRADPCFVKRPFGAGTALLGLNIEGFSFELLMNAGSLIAVLLVYKNDIFRLAVNGLSYVTTKMKKEKRTSGLSSI